MGCLSHAAEDSSLRSLTLHLKRERSNQHSGGSHCITLNATLSFTWNANENNLRKIAMFQSPSDLPKL